ncbi:MAG: hypothetical protein WC307_05525 [Candidatus Nanoarchaeia archaeon]|jgi:hypothetical protein
MKQLLAGLLIILIIGCTSTTDELTELIITLRANSIAVELNGLIVPEFINMSGQLLLVNNEVVQAYVFSNESSATMFASSIVGDGSYVNGIAVNWISRPHFYQHGKLIVIQLGNDEVVAAGIQLYTGPQFAGLGLE